LQKVFLSCYFLDFTQLYLEPNKNKEEKLMRKEISEIVAEVEGAKRNSGVNVRFLHEYMSTPQMVKIRGEWEIHAQVCRIHLPENLSGQTITSELEKFAKIDWQISEKAMLAKQIVEDSKLVRPGTDRRTFEEEAQIEMYEAFLRDYRQALRNLEDEIEEKIEDLQERQVQLISLMLEKSE
jgi:hypothetical protein